MKKIILFLMFISLFFTQACGNLSDSKKELRIYCGAATRPPIDDLITEFKKQTGIDVVATYSGSGTVLSQMIAGKTGDLYIPGSNDYMEKAKAKGVVYPETEKVLAYLVPAIIVKKGNPKGIQTIEDLLRDDVKFGIGTPGAVCLGDVAKTIFKNTGKEELFMKKVTTQAGSCSKTLALVTFGTVDAIIGWDVFKHWQSDKVDKVDISKELIGDRAYYIPAAISKFTKDYKLAKKFLNFISSDIGRKTFKKYGYTVNFN